MEKEIIKEVTKEATKEIAKDLYSDAGKPIVKPTGELLGLVPRAIKAALSPLEKWILQREYNIAETQKLLEEKMQGVSPEEIESPEPYIAVPALQYISYCMDNEDLRNMYANLLANSMNKVVKNGVHPGFIEIIKQLSPDEAKILYFFSFKKIIPTISFRLKNSKGEHIAIQNNFSDIGEQIQCEKPYDIPMYFDNLIRLGLLEASSNEYLTDKSRYEELKANPYIKDLVAKTPTTQEFNITDFAEGFMRITDFGRAFCNICLDKNRVLLTVKSI